MKIKRYKIQKGFSLMEIMFVLIILGGSLVGASILYNNIKSKANYTKQATNLNVYAKKVANYVNANQAVIYSSGTALKTINSEQLMKYGYLKSVKQLDFHDSKTGATLYPCTAVYVQNGHVEGFTYFRTDNVNLSKGNLVEATKMKASIDGLGATGGIINTNNGTLTLRSINGSWSFDSNVVNQYFTKDGQDYLKIQGVSASCKGAYVANPGVVILMNKYFKDINSEVRNDNTVNQNGNNFVSSNNDNSMTSLNLDSKNAISDLGDNNTRELSSTRNSLVFETNKNCIMDPTKLSTMQNYDASFDDGCTTMTPGKCSQITKPNKFGCRNKQLALAYGGGVKTCIREKITNGVADCKEWQELDSVATYGFNDVNSGKNIQNDSLKIDGNLGGTSSKSIQATAQVEYGKSCSLDEIGAISKQKPSNTPPNNLYKKIIDQSQGILVCQKNPLCNDNSTNNPNDIGACWLPSTKVTISIDWTEADKVVSFTAPKGFAILDKNGFKPEYIGYAMGTSNGDIRKSRNGGGDDGNSFSFNFPLSGGGGNRGGRGVTWQDYSSANCEAHSCRRTSPKWLGNICFGPYGAGGGMRNQPAFKQPDGSDYVYFSNLWLSPSSISTDLNINKGFDGGINGTVYTDSGNQALLSKNIMSHDTQADHSVFLWSKGCGDRGSVNLPVDCNVSVYGYVPNATCKGSNGNIGNCMVQQKFTYNNGYPKQLNAMFSLRTTTFHASGTSGNSREGACNNWRDAIGFSSGGASKVPEVFAYPHYITKVTITNDLSQVPFVSRVEPAIPPAPPNCNVNNITQQAKDDLNSNLEDAKIKEFVADPQRDNQTVYNIYVNPNTPKSYEVLSDGTSCKAYLKVNACYITNANNCSYTLLKKSGNFSFGASQNSNMANEIREADGEIGDFNVNKSIYFNVYANGQLIESKIASNVYTGEDNISNRINSSEKTYQVTKNGISYGYFDLVTNPETCNTKLACTSPDILKNNISLVEPVDYIP